MATLVIPAAAGILELGPLASGALTLAAAYVDAKYIFPRLLGGEPTEVPSVGDFELQTATEGSPMAVVTGRSRLAGQVIWMSEQYFEKLQQGQPGGKNQEIIGQRWFVDVAVAICRNSIGLIERIWADGEIVFNAHTEITKEDTYLAGVFHIPRSGFILREGFTNVPGGNPPVQRSRDVGYFDILSDFSVGKPKLSDFRPGEPIEATYGGIGVPPPYAHQYDKVLLAGVDPSSGLSRIRVQMKPLGLVPAAPPLENLESAAKGLPGVTTLPVTALFGGGTFTRLSLGGAHGLSGDRTVYCDVKSTFRPGPGYTEFWGGPFIGRPVSATVLDLVDMPNQPDQSWGTSPVNIHILPADGAEPLSTGTVVFLHQTLPQWKAASGGVIVDPLATEFHYDDPTWTASPIIESYEGVGEVPTFRGTSYVVLKRFALGSFGNRLPNFSFDVTDGATGTLRNAIDATLRRGGLGPLESNTTKLDSYAGPPFKGTKSRGIQPTGDVLAPYLLAHDLLTRVDFGALTVLQRGQEDTINVDPDDLAAVAGSDAAATSKLQIVDASEHRLPRQFWVTYSNEDADLQDATEQDFRNRNQFDSSDVRHVPIPMVMSAKDARDTARRMLAQAYAERHTVTLSLPPRYLHVQESDVLVVEAYDQTWNIVATRVDRGADFRIEVHGFVQRTFDATKLETSPSTDRGDGAGNRYNRLVSTVPPIDSAVVDVAPLSDAHMSTAAVYVAVSPYGDTALDGWALYQRPTDGTTDTLIGAFGSTTIMGRTVTGAAGVLGTASGVSWDRDGSVDVEVWRGDLESVTVADVRSGANLAMIGAEVVGFTTATLIGERTYRLSGFVRGVLATESAIGGHTDLERFVILTGLAFVPVANSLLGRARVYTVVPSGRSLVDSDSSIHIVQGNTARPFPPAKVRAVRDASNNITVTWRRRTRASYRLLSAESPPLVEGTESYRADFVDPSSGTTLRSATVTDVQSVPYTAVEQGDDGHTPGDPVQITVYQVSPVTGAGRPSATLTV